MVSGVITTLGLMVGLDASTNSRLAVLGGILTIAIADACSDALGIHIGEESEEEFSASEVWSATLATFAAKFFFAITFLVPVLLFDLGTAVLVSLGWGLLLIVGISVMIAKHRGESLWRVAGGHVVLTLFVVAATRAAGVAIAAVVG